MTQIMGIVNVTPDSFSDGGRYNSEVGLRVRIAELVAEGADIIDLGGESTRPGSDPVSLEEELRRVLPALKRIREICALPVSIDTTKAEVARQAILAGADMVNDISAATADPAMLAVLQETEAKIILMHRQGESRTMQLAPHYEDVVAEVRAYLAKRVAVMERAGIAKSRLILDPGLGFGKTTAHNLAILRNLDTFRSLGCPLLIGHSRKTFLGEITGMQNAAERDLATAVVSAFCAAKGVDILRVHNVRATKEALLVQRALDRGIPD